MKTKYQPATLKEVESQLKKIIGLPVLEIKQRWGDVIELKFGEPRIWISTSKDGEEVKVERAEYSILCEANWFFFEDKAILSDCSESFDQIKKDILQFNSQHKKAKHIEFTKRMDLDVLKIEFNSGIFLNIDKINHDRFGWIWFSLGVDADEI